MKYAKLSALAFVLVAGLVFGQVNTRSLSTEGKKKADAQLLWSDYKNQGQGTSRTDTLEKLRSTQSLSATSENVREILAILSATKSGREQNALIGLLAQQHLGTEDTRIKTEIEQRLIVLSADKNTETAKTATLSYSRLGYFPETLTVLKRAYTTKIIGNDEYYGDLAHLFDFAPTRERVTILEDIKQSKNELARDIFATTLKNRDFVKSLDKNIAVRMLDVLGGEPAFSQPASSLGGFEALQFESWLYSVMHLRSHISNEPERLFLSQILSSESVDPRKLIASLWNADGGKVLRDNLDTNSLVKIRNAIASYAAANVKDPWIQEIAGTAVRNLANGGK